MATDNKDKIYTFKHKGKTYLSIKNHSFQILNGFSRNGSDVYYQVTSGRSGGITKEYLPNGWDMTKRRYNGHMIYTLYNRNYFRYQTTASTVNAMCFIAPDPDGARWLAKRWWLGFVAVDMTKRAIKLVDDVFWKLDFRTMWQLDDEQPLHGVSLDIGDYYNLQRDVDELKRKVKEGE